MSKALFDCSYHFIASGSHNESRSSLELFIKQHQNIELSCKRVLSAKIMKFLAVRGTW